MDLDHLQHISRLILLYLEGGLSPEEARELEAWRRSSAGNEALFRKMISLEEFERNVEAFVKTGPEREKEWKAIRSRTLGAGRPSLPVRLLRYAAVLVLPLCVWLVWETVHRDSSRPGEPDFRESVHAVLVLTDGQKVDLGGDAGMSLVQLEEGPSYQEDKLDYRGLAGCRSEGLHTLEIPRGGEYRLTLSDGSRVFLNADTRITYPVVFSGDSREVSVEGEAYFDVAEDSRHPFVVKAASLALQVLGTEFAVRAYPDEEEVLATLVEGRLRLSAGNCGVELVPNQQGKWLRKGDIRVEDVDVRPFISWKEGRLVFDNAPLEAVMHGLERWYDLEVEFEDTDLKSLPFTLDMEKHEDFHRILDLLEMTGKMKFSVSGNKVRVNHMSNL